MATSDRFFEALRSRDSRFDGRFYAGVTTTGIYCRPVCPARTPKRDNVRFFECAAAAEAAGFRPCKRCRPETAPGTPAWHGTSTTVTRALRLISQGALDREGVDELAERLGVGSRHLRRLFDRHVGASPLAVAKTRRIHFARKLLDETELPMRDVAFAAGFSSIKRFNTVMRETFRRSPTELREKSRARGTTLEGRVELRLPFREPYDWDGVLDYFRRRAIPRVEDVIDGTYRRTFAYEDCQGVLEVRRCEDRPCVILSVPASARRRLFNLAERVRRLFDLGADPHRIYGHLADDPELKHIVRRRPGLRVPGSWDPFELAVRAILGQQVSVTGATTLAGRLAERFGTPCPPGRENVPNVQFPTPEQLLDAPIQELGMPEKRAEAIRELARRVHTGEIPLSWGECLDDTFERLTAIPGVGAWTAKYVSMRGLGHPDAFLEGDLGVRKALANGGGMPSARQALARSEAWRPWRAYAVLYLWAKGSEG